MEVLSIGPWHGYQLGWVFHVVSDAVLKNKLALYRQVWLAVPFGAYYLIFAET